MRYEPFMRPDQHPDHRPRPEARSDRLAHSIDAVMGEIAALLDERGTGEVRRAREVLADAYFCATERRRARRSAAAAGSHSPAFHETAHASRS